MFGRIFSRLVIAALTLLLITAWQLPTLTPPAIGQQAYGDLVSQFWQGSPTSGHVISRAKSGATNPAGSPAIYAAGDLWSHAVVGNDLYAYWKITGSVDAANQVTGYWNWIKGYYGTSGMTMCGVGNTAVALDDTSQTVSFYLDAYEVTNDSAALTAAKGLLDCGWNRWSDGGTAGCTGTGAVVGAGLWYDDTCTTKAAVMNFYAFDSYRYYQLAGDGTYRTRAINIDTWVAANLQRLGQTVQGQNYPNDGLTWMSMNPDGTIRGINTPYQIRPTSSVTEMSYDMALASLDALLHADTGTASYLSRLQLASVGMYTYYRDGNGVIVAMRDARGDGETANFYMTYVMLPGLVPSGGLGATSYELTAQAVHNNARATDFTYAGCWDGPSSNASCIWATPNGDLSQQVELSANAAIWPITALALP